MRIDAFDASSTAAGEARQPATTSPSHAVELVSGQNASSLPEDHATLSRSETSLESLTSEVMSNAAARSTRIESLKQAVAGGQYTVSADEVAQAMIEQGK